MLLRRGVGVRGEHGEVAVEGERACDQIVIEVTIPPPTLPLPPVHDIPSDPSGHGLILATKMRSIAHS